MNFLRHYFIIGWSCLLVNLFALPVFATDESANLPNSSNVITPSVSNDLPNVSEKNELSKQKTDDSSIVSEENTQTKVQIEQSNEKLKISEEQQEKRATLSYTGQGTIDSPYQVYSIQDLIAVLKIDLPSGQTMQYIQLMNDIIYTSKEINYGSSSYLNIRQNTTIDGQGYALLYNRGSANTDSAHFRTGANNITVNYKNINFGNEQYTDNTWYGILKIDGNNVNFTVENINYTIANGCQPFYSQGSNNTLTIKGKNNFKSQTPKSNGTNGGEFAEGFGNITFAKDSVTTIYNDSSSSDGLFWAKMNSSKMDVLVDDAAEVTIQSSKSYLFYMSSTGSLTVNPNSKFKVLYFKGNYGKSNFSLSSASRLTMTFNENAIGEFLSEDQNGQLRAQTTTIKLNQPNYVLFKNMANEGKSFLSSGTIQLNRIDISINKYPVDYIQNGQMKNLVDNVISGQSQTITTTNVSNATSLAYHSAVTIKNHSSDSTVDVDNSSVNAKIDSYEPATRKLDKAYYKIATDRLYSGKINTPAAQASIENPSDPSVVLDSVEVPIIYDGDVIQSGNSHIFNHLAPETYYIYMKVKDLGMDTNTEYVTKSHWVEDEVQVVSLINVAIPVQRLSFTSPATGEFGRKQNSQDLKILNQGNIPLNINLQSVVINNSEKNSVQLVKAFNTHQHELILNLSAQYSDQTEKAMTWGPLLPGEQSFVNQLALQPFWNETKSNADIYAEGDYSGPMDTAQQLDCSIRFSVSPIQQREGKIKSR